MSPPLRYTPRTPWRRMTDAEWLALLPYVDRRSPAGRPLADLRARMDAIFHVATSDRPWACLPQPFGRPDTVARYFRRLSHGGLWQALARALMDLPEGHPLRALESFICRAIRRAKRLLGLPMLVLLRRLGLRSALAAPPWLLPDPDLSETVLRHAMAANSPAALRRHLPLLRRLAGVRRIPRSVQLGWP